MATGFPVGWAVKNSIPLQETQETQVQSLSQEDPLEEDMATYSSTLTWRIPWTEEPGGLQSMGSQRLRHDWSDLAHTNTKPVWGLRHRKKGLSELFKQRAQGGCSECVNLLIDSSALFLSFPFISYLILDIQWERKRVSFLPWSKGDVFFCCCLCAF